jgi:hypothetical protein
VTGTRTAGDGAPSDGLQIHTGCVIPDCSCHFTQWTFDDAAQWLRSLYASCEATGWLLILVGSVPRNGWGNDLDVVLLQLDPDAPDLWDIWDNIGWRVLDRETHPDGRRERLYVDSENRPIDAMFHPFEQAFEQEAPTNPNGARARRHQTT